MDAIERRSIFYALSAMDGLDIDWENGGKISRKK